MTAGKLTLLFSKEPEHYIVCGCESEIQQTETMPIIKQEFGDCSISYDKLPFGPMKTKLHSLEKLPNYCLEVIQAYESGMRFKQFRNALKKIDRKEKKKEKHKITITHGKTKYLSF